jgi:hypothetical protein
MDFPIFINKFIIVFKPIRYTVFWYWFRYINSYGFRFDDHQRYSDFWLNLNKGYHDTEYKYQFEKVWGKNAKIETIVLSQRDFDALQERLNEPPDPKVIERFREILNRPSFWSDEE